MQFSASVYFNDDGSELFPGSRKFHVGDNWGLTRSVTTLNGDDSKVIGNFAEKGNVEW